jgi:hypothetical protein
LQGLTFNAENCCFFSKLEPSARHQYVNMKLTCDVPLGIPSVALKEQNTVSFVLHERELAALHVPCPWDCASGYSEAHVVTDTAADSLDYGSGYQL